VLRGIDGQPDVFVIGDVQQSGVPFIENLRPEEGDRIEVSVGGIREARWATVLGNANYRAEALAHLRQTLGSEVVDRLNPTVLADLVEQRIEMLHPQPSFSLADLNTHGGILFDVVGRRPLAYVSKYSSTTGDVAWGPLSANPAAGIFTGADIQLSADRVRENAASRTLVGTLSTIVSNPSAAWTYTLVPGEGDADNQRFTISGNRLLTRGTIDYEANPRLSVRLKAADSRGREYEKAFLVVVENVRESASVDVPAELKLSSGAAPAIVFPHLPLGVFDASTAARQHVTLMVGKGALAARSGLGVTAQESRLGWTFEGTREALNRYFTDATGFVRYQPPANWTEPVQLTLMVGEPNLKGFPRVTATSRLIRANSAPAMGALANGPWDGNLLVERDFTLASGPTLATMAEGEPIEAVVHRGGPWRNQGLAVDTNENGVLQPLDALLVLNELHHPTIVDASRKLPATRPAGSLLPYLDVNGDGYCSPLDALAIIHALVSLQEGERESTSDFGPSREEGLLASSPDLTAAQEFAGADVAEFWEGVSIAEEPMEDNGPVAMEEFDRLLGLIADDVLTSSRH
jgi:hypothetical protein